MQDWIRVHSPASESDAETLVDELHALADHHGAPLKQLLEERLLRAQRESVGLRAIGRMTYLGEFPPRLDDDLHRWASRREISFSELLCILSDELGDYDYDEDSE